MFLKRIARRTSGKTLSYWALVESYRTARGPRHRVVSYLGELSRSEQKGWAELLERSQEPPRFRQRELFERTPQEPVPDRVRVDAGRVRVERIRDFGEVWLALVLWQRLGLDRLLGELLPPGQEEEEVAPGVEVKLCASPDGAATFVLAKSRERTAKEEAIHERFITRIEAGVKTIAAAATEGRLKDAEQAGRRIGRLLGANSRAAGCFDVRVKPLDPPQGKARLSIQWSKKKEWQDWARLSEGCYLLRSNLIGHGPAELWRMYMQLVDAEAAFRTHKSELVLRPIWHQHEHRVQAHILVCFLAYVLWKTLQQWMQTHGLGSAPRTLLNELSRLKSTDVILPKEDGREIRLRCVSQPEKELAVLLYRLGIAPPRRLNPPQWVPKEVLARANAVTL